MGHELVAIAIERAAEHVVGKYWSNIEALLDSKVQEAPIYQVNRRVDRHGQISQRKLPDPNAGKRRASDENHPWTTPFRVN